MRITLFGHGRMGCAVEKLAPGRGHEIVNIVDPKYNSSENSPGKKILSEDWVEETDAVIDFSTPDAAVQNIQTCVTAGIPIIEGTTGWDQHLEEVSQFVEEHQGTCIHASNFSVGVQVLFQVANLTGKLMSNLDNYAPFISEVHHARKLDAPSGTAKTLQCLIQPHYNQAIPISSLRAGTFPGKHDVGFDSAIDTLILSHTARNRLGFASGALLAAEKINTVRGFVDFSDVLFPQS